MPVQGHCCRIAHSTWLPVGEAACGRTTATLMIAMHAMLADVKHAPGLLRND